MHTVPEETGYLDVFKYCPKCGAGLKPQTLGFEVMPMCANNNCGFIFWQNSKPCVVGIVKDKSDKILMTIRGIEPEKGKLDLPGGFVGLGELPEKAVKRELKEEIGVKIDKLEFVGVEIDYYFYQGYKVTTIVFGYIATIVDGVPKIADEKEIAGIEWVEMERLNKLDLAFESNKNFLKKISQIY